MNVRERVIGMDIGLGKTIYDQRSGFQRVGLTAEEQRELSQTLRELHVRQMRECIEDAWALLPKASQGSAMRLACALFEKRAPASFTVYTEALDRKVHLLKNGNGGDNHD